jgi:class 3 adenylate cyclase
MAEERKLVSVLFVDIVDSTAHAEPVRQTLSAAG